MPYLVVFSLFLGLIADCRGSHDEDSETASPYTVAVIASGAATTFFILVCCVFWVCICKNYQQQRTWILPGARIVNTRRSIAQPTISYNQPYPPPGQFGRQPQPPPFYVPHSAFQQRQTPPPAIGTAPPPAYTSVFPSQTGRSPGV